MQPTDQISSAAVYSEQLRRNSGALYQRVTTYFVMKSVSVVVLASPKSPILSSQFSFMITFLGLRSQCKTCAECTYFSPRSNWYRKYCRGCIRKQHRGHEKFAEEAISYKDCIKISKVIVLTFQHTWYTAMSTSIRKNLILKESTHLNDVILTNSSLQVPFVIHSPAPVNQSK